MRRLVASALLLAALAAAPAHAGWWDDAAEARATTIADLRREPSPWRDVVAVLDLTFVRVADAPSDAPAGAWRVLEVTGAAPSAPFARLLVRRGTPEEARIETLRTGASLRVRAVVRETKPAVAKGGDPWMELLSVFADGDGLTPEEQTRAARALALLASDNPVGAEKILRELVAARTLAPALHAELLRALGRALRDQAKLDKALEVLTQAHELAPKHVETMLDLELVARALRGKAEGPWKVLAATPAATPAPTPASAVLGRAGTSPPPLAPADAAPRPRLAPPAGLDTAVPPPKPAAPIAAPAPAAPPPPVPAPFLAPPK